MKSGVISSKIPTCIFLEYICLRATSSPNELFNILISSVSADIALSDLPRDASKSSKYLAAELITLTNFS